MNNQGRSRAADRKREFVIRGARLAISPDDTVYGNLRVGRGRIEAIQSQNHHLSPTQECAELDLTGFLLLPGFVNAHDHLEFSLYPRLANPPYRNYVEWGEDIHAKYAALISTHHAVPKQVRLWWGGIRNLLCGVTTVCHHNPLYAEFLRIDFPVRVVRQYGWAHSPALGGDLRLARAATPPGRPFIIHACEGIDARAREELRLIEKSGILDEFLVLVHGLALTRRDVALLRERCASLILCPSSNHFLFGQLPDVGLLASAGRTALGSDSPLTAAGDLLDETQCAIHQCGTEPRRAFQMVTSQAAAVLRLTDWEGSIKPGGVADLIAIRDTGCSAAERLRTLCADDVELVIVGGIVKLVSESMRERLPASTTVGMEQLVVGSTARWVRVPVGKLLQKAEEALGEGQVRLGGRSIRSAVAAGVAYAC